MQNLAKYALKYAAYMRHYGICGVNDACECLCWTKCAEMLKNAIAYAEIYDYMRIYA